MPAANLQSEQELEELVQQQIQAFKESKVMSDRDILEFHLRHYRIRTLLEEMDRQVRQRFRWRSGYNSRRYGNGCNSHI